MRICEEVEDRKSKECSTLSYGNPLRRLRSNGLGEGDSQNSMFHGCLYFFGL